jgi:hypothetical protein
MNRLPNLLIIGAQKSGTTWLYSKLAQHPEIFFSKRKEPEFFTTPEQSRDTSEYQSYFADAVTQRYAGEATSSYFWTYDAKSRFCRMILARRNVNVPEAIKSMLGEDVKLIVILRHPVHRAVSAYFHHVKKGRIKAGQDILTIGRRYGIIDIGFYERHFLRWESVFGPNKILTLFFDDVRRDAVGTLARAFRYLDLEPCPVTDTDARENIGYKLVRDGDALMIDHNDPMTYQFLRRRRVENEKSPRVDEEALIKLQRIYSKDIRFIETKFERRDLRWRRRPKLEDFIS